MSKRFLVLILVLVLALAVPLTASATNVTSYTSGIQLQNLETTDVDIVLTFYNHDGTVAATQQDSITASGSKTFYPLSAVTIGFNGSVIVSSNGKVSAIVNVLGNSGKHSAAYGGFSTGATTINIPLVQKNNYGINSWFNVQNAGPTDATVEVAYPGSVCTENAVIKPGAAHTFDQATNVCLPDPAGNAGYVGSARVTSDQPVVATVMQVQSDAFGLKAALLAYNGFTGTSTNPVAPLVSSGWYGSITGIQIQNTGAQATDVTVSYTPSAGFPGAACSETKSIPAGQSVSFGLSTGNLLPAVCLTLQSGQTAFVGSAKVTTNTTSQPLVASVNQINSKNASAATYAAFGSGAGTTKVSFPLIADRNYAIFSGFSVANMGNSPADITCTFTNSAVVASATDVPSGASFAHVQLNAIADKYVGSAICTSDQPIVGTVNYLDPGTKTGAEDGLSVYEGVNIAP